MSPTAAEVTSVRRELFEAVSTCAADGMLVVALPAPNVAPEQLIDALDGEVALIRTPDEAIVGLGVARVIRAEGPDRLRELRLQVGARSSSVRVAIDGAAHDELRWLGGVAFDADSDDADRWSAFGAARFVLPRWTWRRTTHGRTLVLVLVGSSAAIQREAAEVVRAYDRIVCAGDRFEDHPCDGVVVGDDGASYRRAVEVALAKIHAGEAEKVVLSRDIEVRAKEPYDVATVARRLADTAPLATFVFRIGSQTFIGATPERLASVRGVDVYTEAVAGSAPANTPELVDTEKNRREHHAVVRWLVERLEPLAEVVTMPSAPNRRTLPNVVHLVTPIVARLTRGPTHVLEVADALFPTPAVAGTPLTTAVGIIRAEEGRRRGWYAGLIGSFGPDGDGELFVALRCALIDGCTATVFAGAGIVAGSEPEAELEETRVKARGVLTALGVPT